LYSCSDLSIKKEKIENNIIEIFTIDKLSSVGATANMTKINDSLLLAWDQKNSSINWITKIGKEYKKSAEKHIEHSEYFKTMFWNEGIINLIDAENYVYSYDTVKGLQHKFKLDLSVPFLQHNFVVYSENTTPIIINEKNMYFNISTQSGDLYYEQLKGFSMAKISFDKDSFNNVEYLFQKPKILEDQVKPYPSYCFNGKQIVLIYPNIDSLYIYDIATKQYSQKHIGNAEYMPHESADKKRIFDVDYTLVYDLHHFHYESIKYNPDTKHYVLFYWLPVDKKIKVPMIEDLRISALVLNENLEPIKYFGTTNLYVGSLCFFNNSSAIPMLLYNDNFKNNVQFDYKMVNF